MRLLLITPKVDPTDNLFGHVTSGLDTVLAVGRGDVMNSVTIEELPAS